MTSTGDRRFAFYAKRYTRSQASIRLRVLEPIAGLREAGVNIGRYSWAKGLRGCDGLVISKAFTKRSVRVAQAAQRAGCGLIFDICDNRFANRKQKGLTQSSTHISRQLARADLVTVPTETMGRLLEAEVPDIVGRVRVVPDMLEDLSTPGSAGPSLVDRFRLSRLRSFLADHPGALRCVWFGNNMRGVSGIDHLDEAVRELREFAAYHPVTLTIISDRRDIYRQASAAWDIPSFYMPWSLGSFGAALKMHRVAIIPVFQNDYTLGKSINRPATAIMAGLGVIADSIPAYEELRPFIPLDDWQGGLSRYAFEWEAEQTHLTDARAHLDRLYGRRRVVQRWIEVLAELQVRRSGKEFPSQSCA